MWSDLTLRHIQPLTEEHIHNLYFPDLMLCEDTPLEEQTAMKLTILKRKIQDFKNYKTGLSKSFPTYSIVMKNFVNDLEDEYGDWRCFENDGKKQFHREEYSKIMKLNGNFIETNRNKILERIDEVYKIHAEKVKERERDHAKNHASEIVKCDCGAMLTRGNLYTHKKSKKHETELCIIMNGGVILDASTKKQLRETEKLKCECGELCLARNLDRHRKSKKHLNWIGGITGKKTG